MAGDIPLLPTPGATPGSFQILPAVAVSTALHRGLTPHLVIPVHHGHRAPDTLLLPVPLQPRHIPAAVRAAVAAVAEGDNTI
jgi:hypothetical protein